MNEPSAHKLLEDYTRLIHALLDVVLDGKRFNYHGYFPVPAQERIEKALLEGKLSGYLKEKI